MSPPPNEVYTVFSFVGFVLCAIPLYLHREAWNAGTCLYVIWTGLGCLLQCLNSIVWNKNIVNRVPIYCFISTRIQVALNVALPASSLCINRRLYRVASIKLARAKLHRNLINDSLIGLGIPVLQVVAQYIVSGNRYNIFEDFGPFFSIWNTPLAYALFFAWPVVIGTVSLFYGAMAIYVFYRRRQNNLLLIPRAHRGRYVRPMAISFIEILVTVPLGTYYIVSNAKTGVIPWPGWAAVHSHHSEVDQIAGIVWRNDPVSTRDLEMFRWSLVVCAFIFFALFSFAGDARQQYYRLYNSFVRRIGKSTPTSHGAPLATPSVPHVQRNGGVTITIEMGQDKDSLTIKISNQSSTVSISAGTIPKEDSVTLQDSDSDLSFYTAKSFDEIDMGLRCQLAPPPGILQTVRPSRPVSVQVPSAPPPVFPPTIRPASMPSAPSRVVLPTLHPASILHDLPEPDSAIKPVHAS